MIPHWPAQMRQTPRRRSWRGGPQEDRAVFQPELGPPLTRARTTGAPELYEAVFPQLTDAHRAAFETWARVTLANCTKPFSWRDPSGRIGLWHIVGDGRLKYDLTDLGAGHHDLAVTLVRRPGTPWWAAYVLPGECRVPYVVADYALGIYAVAGERTPASAVAAVSGTFDVYTTDGWETSEPRHAVAAGDIPASAPGTVTRILAFVPEA